MVKIFRGFALMARRDFSSSGIAHPRTPTPKRQRSGLIFVEKDFNHHHV